jgi:hypothetical protein
MAVFETLEYEFLKALVAGITYLKLGAKLTAKLALYISASEVATKIF